MAHGLRIWCGGAGWSARQRRHIELVFVRVDRSPTNRAALEVVQLRKPSVEDNASAREWLVFASVGAQAAADTGCCECNRASIRVVVNVRLARANRRSLGGPLRRRRIAGVVTSVNVAAVIPAVVVVVVASAPRKIAAVVDSAVFWGAYDAPFNGSRVRVAFVARVLKSAGPVVAAVVVERCRR